MIYIVQLYIVNCNYILVFIFSILLTDQGSFWLYNCLFLAELQTKLHKNRRTRWFIFALIFTHTTEILIFIDFHFFNSSHSSRFILTLKAYILGISSRLHIIYFHCFVSACSTIPGLLYLISLLHTYRYIVFTSHHYFKCLYH